MPRDDYETSDDELDADSVVKVLRLRSMLQHPLVDRHLVVPDDFVFWYTGSRREAVELAKKIRPDIVLSALPPYTNSLIALAAANGVKAPMVVDFRDPWSKEITYWRPRSGLQKYVTALFEKRISRQKSAVVMADPKRYRARLFCLFRLLFRRYDIFRSKWL